MLINYLLLLIFHTIGDFYLQTDKIAKCKSANINDTCNKCKKCKENAKINVKYLFIHSVLYSLPFAILFFISSFQKAIICILIISITHFVIDMVICFIKKDFKQTIVFIVDQILHLTVLYLVLKYLLYEIYVSQYIVLIKIIFIVLALIKPTSIFINKLMEDVFRDNLQTDLFDVGSIIGILERILVIIFCYFDNLTSIAIIITAKTWARSNDLKDSEFRKKYILGTFFSLVLALLLFLVYKN